jgi:hypothetical protein
MEAMTTNPASARPGRVVTRQTRRHHGLDRHEIVRRETELT